MDTVSLPLDALHPDPSNARQHGERNLEAIRASLATFGLAARIAMIAFKLSLKGCIVSVVWVVYLIFPIDLVPDFIPALGHLDDIVLLIGLGVWVVLSALGRSIRAQVDIRRPETPFP